MLWFENARRLDSAISPKAVLCNLPKLRHNRAESMWRREGAHRTDEVSWAWIPKPPAIIDGNQVGDHIAPLASIS